MCIYVYIYTYTHTHIYIYTHTHTCRLNPIKAPRGTGSWPFSFERSTTLPSQADQSCLGRLTLICGRWGQQGAALWAESPTPPHIYTHTCSVMNIIIYIYFLFLKMILGNLSNILRFIY